MFLRAMTRRTFGQTIGAAAMGGTLPEAFWGLGSSGADAFGSQSAQASQSRNSGDDLCYLSAVELVARMRRKQVSAREVMAAHLAQIERMNPKVNAIVT